MEEERKTKRQLKISCPGSPAAGRPAYIYIVKGARTDLVCPTLLNRMAAVQIVLTSLRLQMSVPRLFMTHDRGGKNKTKKTTTLSSAASAAEGGSVNALRMEKRGAKSLITRKRSNGCKETDPVHQLTGFVLLDRVGPRGLPASEQTTQIGTNLFEKPLQTYIV